MTRHINLRIWYIMHIKRLLFWNTSPFILHDYTYSSRSQLPHLANLPTASFSYHRFPWCGIKYQRPCSPEIGSTLSVALTLFRWNFDSWFKLVQCIVSISTIDFCIHETGQDTMTSHRVTEYHVYCSVTSLLMMQLVILATIRCHPSSI